jgi:hypothetical protein
MENSENISGVLLKKLVLSRHLNAEERKQFGREKIHASEIVKIIQEALEKSDSFPPGVHPWKEGEIVYEGFIIEKLASGKFRLHCQRHYAIVPWAMAESKQWDYSSVQTVAKAFVSKEYGTHVDGIAIEHGFFWKFMKMLYEPLEFRFTGRGR